jgi:hypothetical protein
MAAGALHQELAVARSREMRLLRVVVEPREVVGGFLDEAPDIAPGGLRQRCLGEERRPRVGLACAGLRGSAAHGRRAQQPVDPECPAVEEDGRA